MYVVGKLVLVVFDGSQEAAAQLPSGQNQLTTTMRSPLVKSQTLGRRFELKMSRCDCEKFVFLAQTQGF